MPVALARDERPPTVQIAKEIINEIRRDRGNIDANDEIELNKTSAEWREDYIRRVEKHRTEYARYTKTVADQLYTSKFRFIHELLQNADDAEYSPGVSPTLTFRVRPMELIVDSNEKGFTKANVQAICSTGESSKLHNLDTTGEKGLGFKSNFGIANKIHVQSGTWSFRFEHSRGESGLGMVTPIWTQAPQGLSSGIGTRFSLTYAEQNEVFLSRIVDEFDKLADTILFALRKLNKLVVAFEEVKGRRYQKSFERVIDKGAAGETMTITTSISGSTIASTSSNTILRIVREEVRDMPSDEWRSRDTSEVALGFQVSSSGGPVVPLRGQHVFAYLPVQRLSDLPFIIQGDFVLAANREAIPENDWNNALIDGVVDAFEKAVHLFCTPGDLLFYQWMEYLPCEMDAEDIWENLEAKITSRLSISAVVESRSNRRLTYPAFLRTIPRRFQFEGNPLVPDLPHADIYVSDCYSSMNLDRLVTLGLTPLKNQESFDRIKYDAELSDSRLYNKDLEDDWHTAFLSYIGFLLQKKVKGKVHTLKIIPLTTGEWVSRDESLVKPVYLPYAVNEDSVQIEIPENISLRKLHTKVYAVGERRNVYTSLGVTDCDPRVITQKVLEAQRSDVPGQIVDFVRQFEILFWFGHTWGFGSQDLVAIDERKVERKAKKLFFRSTQAYHAADLLGQSPITAIPGYGFLRSRYIKSPVRDFIRNGKTWSSWLENVAGVRNYPGLFDEDHRKLHPWLMITARNDSSKFLAALRTHWKASYSLSYQLFSSTSTIKQEVRQTLVHCRNGQTCELSNAVLPSPEAVSKSQDFGVEGHLLFVSLPGDAFKSGPEPWSFLQMFGVVCETNLEFHFKVLESLKTRQLSTDRKYDAVNKAYESIVQFAKLGDAELLQERFSAGKYICASPMSTKWYAPNECLWGGPSVLWTKPIIRDAYAACPAASRLFVDLLGLRDADCDDLMSDLTKFRDTHPMPECLERLETFYEALSELAGPTDSARIRDTFETHSLIYARDCWIKPSQAIWNCSVSLSGLTPVGELYPSLESFFRQKVGVRRMSLKVLMEQLVRASSTGIAPDGEEIRAIMINAGQIMAADPDSEDLGTILQDLRKNRYLPVRRDEGWLFLKPSGNYFIIDHERFAAAFSGKVNVLDFKYDQLTSLHPLFQALGLEHRYISHHVDSETMVSEVASHTSSELTSFFQQRAYALSCCAIYYQSSKYLNQGVELHNLLMSSEVLLCDDMWTKLVVKLGDRDVEARSDRALVKIKQTQDSLKIYVPSNKGGLHSCIRTELPAVMASILGIEDQRAVKQVYRILNDEATELDAIMKDEDLPHIAWLMRTPEVPRNSRNHIGVLPSSPGPLREPCSPSTKSESPESESPEYSDTPASTSPPPAYSDDEIVPEPIFRDRSPSPLHPSGGIVQRVIQQNAYGEILQNVLEQARRLSANEQRTSPGILGANTFSMSTLASALEDLEPSRLDRRFRGNEPMAFAETSKLGAAGELFVFERLIALGMPGFTRDNWQSTIRSLVGLLPEYSNLENWSFPEVSDIVYETASTRFEEFLRGNAVNSFPSWDQSPDLEPIKYLIEVKTTTGPSSTPFYMSRNQYKLMEEHKFPAAEGTIARPRTVYVIFRVYNLASDNIGLKIFVDPWWLRDDLLKFKSGSWTVYGP